MKRKNLAFGVIVATGCGALALAAWLIREPVPASAAAPPVPASALVQSAAVRRQALLQSMQVFGEIASGKVEALSFPQAGQLSTLAVVPGQAVMRGALLAILSTDPAARTAYAQAAQAVTFAQTELTRNEDLLALRLATQGQVDAAAKQARDAESALKLQASLGGALGTVRLQAPFDAVVGAILPSQGERLAAGATVMQLGRSDSRRVLLAIDPGQSDKVRAGMAVTLHATQAAMGANSVISARIGAVQQQVDPKTQMVTAVVTLNQGQQARLVPGMRMTARIALDSPSAWTVPRQAVLSDEKGSYLFQVAAGKARRVAVTRIGEAGAMVGVDGALDAALPVVVVGNYELQDGMAVREGAP